MLMKTFLEIVKILILLLKSKKVIFKVSYKTIWSRSRSSDLRPRGAGAEKNIVASTTVTLIYNMVLVFIL